MAITHMSAHVARPRSSPPKERVPFFFKALLRSALGAGGEDEDVSESPLGRQRQPLQQDGAASL